MDSFPAYIAIAIFIIVGTGIALFAKRFLKSEPSDFYTAGGRFGTILAALSYAKTTYSAFMFIGLVGLVYATGVGGFGFELVYFIGTLFLLTFLAPKYWSLHNKYGYISPVEILSDRYGSRVVGTVVTLLALVSLIPYISAQVIGVAVAAQGSSGGAIPYVVGVAIAIGVALLWVVIAGIWSVGWTDVFQGLVMIVAAFIIVIWVYIWGFGSTGFDMGTLGALSYVPNQTWSFPFFLNFTLPWFFFAIINPQVVQRIFAPKNKRALNGMIVWFGVFGIIITVLVTFLGLMLKGLSLNGMFPTIVAANRDSVTPTLLGIAPTWLSVIGLLAVLAASVSIIDGIILTLSSMTVRDVLEAYRPSSSKRLGLVAGRGVILAMALSCAVFALARPGFIVNLSVLSASLLLPQAPIVLGMFLWKKGGKCSAVLAVVSGFAVAVTLYLMNISPLGIPANVWTLAVASVAYISTALIEKPPATIEKFTGV